ncbi:MAG: 50S ribosomal protein L9 [Firmicutes bacterium]|nr:50S ribosomal protein L9 [Bacillota bacterium]
MKVILKADVKGIGKAGSTVEVKDGYARNYLLPRGLAVEASAGALKELEQQKAAQAAQAKRELLAAQAVAEKIHKRTVVVKVKTGENGKLFGSITSKDVAEAITKTFQVTIDKRKVELSEPIKSLGVYQIEVKIHPEVTAIIDLQVVAE